MNQCSIFLMTTLAILMTVTPAETANREFIAGAKDIRAFIDAESVSGSPEGPREGWINYRLPKPNGTAAFAKSKKQNLL